MSPPKSLSISSQQIVPLKYTIANCSEHSGRYVAEHIIVDKPTDPSSRWSSAHQGHVKSWITLRLNSLSVVKSITFGKFHKIHVCNMKDFKVYVGRTEENMTEVLHGGLKNDPAPETFQLRCTNKAGFYLASNYVKIVPLSAHGQSFHTSIWHVSLEGISNEPFIKHIRTNFDEHQENMALRLVLKHLRQRCLLKPYMSILSRFPIQVEHPLVSELFNALVLEGDFVKCTDLLPKLAGAGLFSNYLKSQPPHSNWRRVHGVNADGDIPTPRGGHAMCIDPANEVIYLLGGWDGERSLDDFWRYDMRQDRWHVLSSSTSQEKNGPGPRSCHKMVFDVKTGYIYVLGRLSEGEASARGSAPSSSTAERRAAASTQGQGSASFCSEFYRYHTRGLTAGKWDLLSFDTASSGGPPLICDHQMVIDSDAQIIYVFGGGVVDGASPSNNASARHPSGTTTQPETTVKYSGFYSYNIRISKWRLLQPADASMTGQIYMPPRSGHSMVMDPTTKTIFIFAGQRDDKFLSDMYAYDIATSTVTELYNNYTACGGPEPFFTQRAVIDPVLKEIYIFSGLTRSQTAGSTTILSGESPNWVYRYEPRPGRWTQILPEPESVPSLHPPGGNVKHPCTSGEMSAEDIEEDKEPLPRYAHQVVYDPNSKRAYLHGGNGGIVGPLERPGSPDSDIDEVAERREYHDAQIKGEGDERKYKDDRKETRLDDFWIMNLTRPQPSEIIRRGTYLIRRQQFREMCEKEPSVTALHFLQNEVYNVVNHNDPGETETFRSLLTHLLAPAETSPSPTGTSSAAFKGDSVKNKIGHDEDESESPPRKRSRSCTPSSDASWTNRLDGDESPSADALQFTGMAYGRSIGDAEELQERADGEGVPPSRFKQRTEVFEAILEFIDEDAKQPGESILDLVPLDV